MDPNKEVTSADLAKISSSLAILGYSISLLALERADQEKQKKESMSAAINYLFKRFRR
ncbi:hypothetical protein A8990_107179 [Paenibacillus taihuensis]|uniref:Uncharacterized protein n=1 Tax=Paenibacillus taihuensis TaxID=1156355 RepID=A0A3D9SDJ0_9BACL|nr:hypothetical protein [Paenibacillus taihuensis]REE89081.1 hypothetical protein A8990_107179 [Paenibacillus taihuensis]